MFEDLCAGQDQIAQPAIPLLGLRHLPHLRRPDMGQDNREIASSLGYDADDIDAMVRDGVLYSPQ